MAEVIQVDTNQLRYHADILRRDANSMQEYLVQIFNALSPHDPSNGGGDEVGKALGAQYFQNANQLLHVAGIAALVLKDIADLTIAGAEYAGEVEVKLAQLIRDLGVGDPKLPPPLPGDSGTTPGHRR